MRPRVRHVQLQLPLTIKEKLHVTDQEQIKLLGVYIDESQLCRHVASIFRGVRFNKETDQTRPEVQLSRDKIGLSETTLRICME